MYFSVSLFGKCFLIVDNLEQFIMLVFNCCQGSFNCSVVYLQVKKYLVVDLSLFKVVCCNCIVSYNQVREVEIVINWN